MDEALLSKPASEYRPDIDGLRAVAVISVFAFHVGLSRASGGFVAVYVSSSSPVI